MDPNLNLTMSFVNNGGSRMVKLKKAAKEVSKALSINVDSLLGSRPSLADL